LPAATSDADRAAYAGMQSQFKTFQPRAKLGGQP
jgi:hypothetical protein